MTSHPADIHNLPRVLYARPAPRLLERHSPRNCGAGISYSGVVPESAGRRSRPLSEGSTNPVAQRPEPLSPITARGDWAEVAVIFAIALFMVGWLSLVFL